MRRLLLLSALLGSVFSGPALAGDQPDIVQQGFSPDARYHLLITSLYRDVTALPSAALQITDVSRNVIVYRREMDWGETETRPLEVLLDGWWRGQAAVLARYGLSRPISGTRIYAALPQEMVRNFDNTPPGTEAQPTPVGKLSLKTFPLRSACKSNNGHPTQGFTLKFNTLVLQTDARLPASRECATSYRLETAWTYKSALAVVLNSYEQTSEAPDRVLLVVTAQLK